MFYNDFIIKSKRYKTVKCLCFHFVKFTFFCYSKSWCSCVYLDTLLFHMYKNKIRKFLQSHSYHSCISITVFSKLRCTFYFVNCYLQKYHWNITGSPGSPKFLCCIEGVWCMWNSLNVAIDYCIGESSKCELLTHLHSIPISFFLVSSVTMRLGLSHPQ